jgi:hypothetical protein
LNSVIALLWELTLDDMLSHMLTASLNELEIRKSSMHVLIRPLLRFLSSGLSMYSLPRNGCLWRIRKEGYCIAALITVYLAVAYETPIRRRNLSHYVTEERKSENMTFCKLH